MAAGLPVPRRIFAHGWWTVEGQKMSKSIGNVVDPVKLVETYGVDPVRYFLLREVPFGNDGDFSARALIRRLNLELANDLGNLAQRVLPMIARNCGARLPPPGAATPEDEAFLESARGLPALMREQMDRQALHESIEAVWRVIRAGNAYVDHQAPWALRRTDPVRMEAVLRVLADALRIIATVLQPVMPGSMSRMLDQLGVPAGRRNIADLQQPLADGTPLPAPEGIFPKVAESGAS
jgi:methionyl-tRNA synthetase